MVALVCRSRVISVDKATEMLIDHGTAAQKIHEQLVNNALKPGEA